MEECTGPVLPVDSSLECEVWRCGECGAEAAGDRVRTVVRELEREMMDTMDTETEKYRGFIQTYSKLLHPNHYQVLTLTTYSHSNKKNTLCISLQIV